jgi:threonine-phosphate decarboxylase
MTHGGDVWQVAEEFGIEASELLDFSANINPRGLPEAALRRLASDAANPRLLSFYPDPSARALRRALREKLGVPEDSILVGPGAEALLSPIVRTIAPRRALIPMPAFSEYRRVCEAEGIEVMPFPLDRSELFRVPSARLCDAIETGDLVFVNNPHNPSGSSITRSDVEQIRQMAAAREATVLLDEAFVDYVPELSLALQAARDPRVVVLRALTKFYGCPALRVGYAIAQPETVRRMRSLLPAWSVTQLAFDTLVEAIGDHGYEARSIADNALERERLAGSLAALGFLVLPSAANYLLIELPDGMPSACELRRWLITNHHILIRNCDSYEGLSEGRYIRVAVRGPEDNLRIIATFALFHNST